VTTATDVYALGVLLYQLLSGRHPTSPRPGSTAEVIRATLETEPLRAVTLRHAATDGADGAASTRLRCATPRPSG
jgi:serine/threonine protein kinase